MYLTKKNLLNIESSADFGCQYKDERAYISVSANFRNGSNASPSTI